MFGGRRCLVAIVLLGMAVLGVACGGSGDAGSPSLPFRALDAQAMTMEQKEAGALGPIVARDPGGTWVQVATYSDVRHVAQEGSRLVVSLDVPTGNVASMATLHLFEVGGLDPVHPVDEVVLDHGLPEYDPRLHPVQPSVPGTGADDHGAELQAAGLGALEALLDANADRVGGWYWAPQPTGGVRVQVLASTPEAVREAITRAVPPGLPVAFEVVEHSRAHLAAQTAEARRQMHEHVVGPRAGGPNLPAALAERGLVPHAVGYEQSLQEVTVEVADEAGVGIPSDLADLIREAGLDPSLVTVVVAEPAGAADSGGGLVGG